jgi:hypothetical protein
MIANFRSDRWDLSQKDLTPRTIDGDKVPLFDVNVPNRALSLLGVDMECFTS